MCIPETKLIPSAKLPAPRGAGKYLLRNSQLVHRTGDF